MKIRISAMIEGPQNRVRNAPVARGSLVPPGHSVVVVRRRVTKVTTFSNFFSERQNESKKRRVIENRVTFVTFPLEIWVFLDVDQHECALGKMASLVIAEHGSQKWLRSSSLTVPLLRFVGNRPV